MTARLTALVVGYLCGCFLTADFVARRKTGKWAREQGSGNPGMANIGKLFGVRAAAVVLAGDIAKVLAASIACQLVFPAAGRIVVLWAGLGATLGHNFPFWTDFRGGKGVTTTCTALIWFDPVWGTIACLVGFAVVLATRQLCFGAIAIAVAFLPMAYFAHGPEAFALACGLAALMILAHGGPARRALRGEEPETDLVSKLKGN